MNDPVNPRASNWVRFAPGNPVLKGVNWGGLKTLYIKEVRRFFKVQMQTVWAPAITTLLYLAIFTVALGRGGGSCRLARRGLVMADRRRALLEPEAVGLADHRIAADAAQFVGDLAGGGAVVPHLLQPIDALFSP